MSQPIQVLLNSIFSFVYIFIVAKILGKKQLSQLTVVDYVVGITIGNIAGQWCTDKENPWYVFVISIGVFLIFSLVIDFFERKAPFKDILKGKEIEIMSEGKINYKNLKKSNLDVNDLLGLCREKNYFDLNEISYIYFENNGNISILPKGNKRPTIAEDLVKLDIKKTSPASYLIIDGKIVKKALEDLHKDTNWLFKQCNISNSKDIKNIILAEYIEDSSTINIHYKK